ncbi:multiple epidermal growth factor-like domains protein 11 isoform X2 [Haliotis asinina]|uniref:multiple epidermal growth factor-like domains protein 11 isoform X2 n=1 Tax=Haliotis asinina TaxID=109174 RepID=UPI003531F859
MYLGTAALFVIFLGHCSCNCPGGTYGYNCDYTCNCEHTQCDPTSGCSLSNCFPGWSGPTCQKHNVARGKPTSSSGDVFPSSRATDGNIAAINWAVCIQTNYSNPSWWRVDLSDTVLIRDVTIYFRTDFTPRRNGIQVYLTNTTITPSGLLCYTVTGRADGFDINDIMSVPCHGRGRYVLLYTTTANDRDRQPTMDFCEVEVNVCGPGAFGADCENYCHCKHGVCNYITGICPPGGCLSGWKGTKCDVKCVDSVEYGHDCGGTCSARKCNAAGSPCPRDTGRCDGGCQLGWKGVDCTSECSNTYGDGCSKRCSSRHCGASSSTCDHVTGACDHGCSAGWKDVDCVTECVQGMEYGFGCHKTCSTRMCQGDTSTCPQDTGRCTEGCQPGWKGEDCTTECIQGVEYGVECAMNCRTRMCQGDTSTCPRETGRCTDGCQAGWRGVDCTSECIDNVEYGHGCGGTCSARKCKVAGSPCPLDTGRCDGGCQSGWEGVDCTSVKNCSGCPDAFLTECTTNVNYGLGCHGNCSARKCKEVSGTCPRRTGRCEGGCQAGWEGVDCTLKCPPRSFGVNCSSKCGHCVDDEPCHHVTGTCPKGCSSGWVSDTCRQAVDSSPGTSTERISRLAAGFIGAFAMLLLLALVIVAVCLWRKGDFRMAKKSSKEYRSPETNPAPPVEVPAYDVLPEHDYTKLERIHTEHYDTLQPPVDYQNSDVRI